MTARHARGEVQPNVQVCIAAIVCRVHLGRRPRAMPTTTVHPQLKRRAQPGGSTPSSTNSKRHCNSAIAPRAFMTADVANGVTRTPPPPRAGCACGRRFVLNGNMRRECRPPLHPETRSSIRLRKRLFLSPETLPNYVVKQYTTRYEATVARGSQTSWQALDHVTADVIEEDGTEKYKNILVNGQPPRVDIEKTGSWSRGEFSSLQLDVLSPNTNARFPRQTSSTTIVKPGRVLPFL